MAGLDPIALVSAGPAAAAATALSFELAMANRHGLVAGATGTGKTVTLQSLAERFSSAGVPVFLADVKGDLSGLAAPGRPAGDPQSNPRVEAGLAAAGMAGRPRAGLPAILWDVYGERGVPLRAAVSDMGPILLARALGLSEVQAEVLSVVFKAADDRGLDILDLKDLRAVLDWCAKASAELEPDYGRMAGVSLSAIARAVVVLEGQGGDIFFGEPALDIADFMGRDPEGRGRVSVLAAERLMESPALYAAFLLWLLSELFEELPEAGDLAAPRLVFFFDEAHLIFDGAPPELVRSVARTVRLIRSKGVGVWFVTQNPLDLPEEVLAQLGNRVQHALRAYTQKELRAAKAAAESFRPNPALDVEAVLGELAVGEALVSFLGPDGVPAPVQRARIVPPLSRLGPLSEEERSGLNRGSEAMARYGKAVDRTSAFEILRGGADPRAEAEHGQRPAAAQGMDDAMAALEAELHGLPGASSGSASWGQAPAAPSSGAPEEGGPYWGEPEARPRARAATGRGSGGMLESMAASAMRSAGTELGRQLVRGVLGGLAGGSRRRRRSW